MEDCKEIDVFIASSEELLNERLLFSRVVQKANDLLDEKDMTINVIKWEYLDASMGVKAKQDEYNDEIRECDYTIALFWRKLGDYTLEELELSLARGAKGEKPYETFTIFKKTVDDTESEPLDDLRRKLEDEGKKVFEVSGNHSELLLRYILILTDILKKEGINLPSLFTLKGSALKSGISNVLDLDDVPIGLKEEFLGYRKI